MISTRCRICESACGLLATVEHGVVTRLRPDPDHPVSRGYACSKGPAFAAVQNHALRVIQPLVRRGDGLAPATWEVALSEVGTALGRIAAEHGPDAVGLYLGNASGHSLGAVLGGTALQEAAGTHKVYSALTLDNSEMFVVLEQVMGNPMRTFLADYAGSDLVVLLGTDPVASQPSQVQSRPGAIPDLLDRARDGGLVVIDPRASETAKRASLHLAPRPGGETPLLAWLVREALGSAPHRAAATEDPLLDPSDLAALAEAVAGFDAARAAAATGLDEPVLLALRDRLLGASRPLVWSGLGVLLGPDGTLGYWLTLCLQAVLRGIDRPGGYLMQRGPVDLAALTRRLGVIGSDPTRRSRIGQFPAVLGTLASATLADDILTPGEGQLRALVVLGGNPALTLPDTPRARKALASLELLVCVDLFVNDTGALAHAVLPAATWLERDEVDLHTGPQRPEARLTLDRAVVPPRGEARSDWEIMLALARAAGWHPMGSALADVALRGTGIGPVGIARAASVTSPVSWRAVTRPGGAVVPRPLLGALRDRGTDRLDRRLLLAVPTFVAALSEPVGFGEPPRAEGELALQLVTSVRPVETMNSWMHDGKGAQRRVPRARLHPAHVAALGSPGRVRLRRPDDLAAAVTVAVLADAGVRPGVVVLPFGWGHGPGAVGAGDGEPGVSANTLVGSDRLERFTGQPVSNGRWVLASAAPAED